MDSIRDGCKMRRPGVRRRTDRGGGVGLGFGGQQYDRAILFETADRLKTCIDGG
jgi:hypothetical protein